MKKNQNYVLYQIHSIIFENHIFIYSLLNNKIYNFSRSKGLEYSLLETKEIKIKEIEEVMTGLFYAIDVNFEVYKINFDHQNNISKLKSLNFKI